MKRSTKSMLGVTLLEIMLVLAIAAMIIVMSVRYYQSAQANQQANAVLSEIQAITASADALAQGTGSYAGLTTDTVIPMLPSSVIHGGTINTPWGGTITVTGKSSNTYEVSLTAMPASVCSSLKAQLQANSKFTGVTNNTCTAGANATFTYGYDSQK